MSRHTITALLFLAFATPVPAAVSSGELLDRPDIRWRTGPARYLLTREEDAAFKKLKTDDERKTFVTQFWEKRDPTPGTPANEFKDMYAHRLSVVDQRFGPPEGLGWEEDRGKTVLLLGPPDSVEVREGQSSGGADAGGASSAPRRKITFTYTHEVVPGAPNPLKLEFAQESAGGYPLLTRYDFTHPRLTGLEPVAPAPAPAAAAPAAAGASGAAPSAPSGQSAPAAAPEPAPAPAPAAPPTPQQELIDEIVAGTTPPQKLPVAARVDYRKTSGGGTNAMVTLAVRKTASTDPPIVAARIQSGEEEPVARLDRENSFSPLEDNGKAAAGSDLLYQAVRDLPPGKYSLVAAAKDSGTGDKGFVLTTIDVADFHQEALQLSTVTLARKVERLKAPAEAGARFVIGNFTVVPAPRAQFKAGEDVALHYEIYNTASDPASGQPKLKVSYRFEKIEKTKNVVLGGRPIEQTTSSAVQAYALQVQQAWPAGDYQVVVKVDDLIAGTSASATVPFSVVK